MHRATPRFWAGLAALPDPVQKTARDRFKILKTDPSQPALHFKKVGELWSVRADYHHRALAMEDGTDFIWIWIGSHDEYERLVRQKG